MAARRGVAVLAVTHLRKSPGAAVHRAIGSIAFAAAARAVWAIAPDPEDGNRRLMLAVKQNLAAPGAGMAFRVIAPDGTARLEWESGAISLRADDVLGEPAERDGGALGDAKEFLASVLASGPIPVTEIRSQASAAGIAWRTVRRAAHAMRIVSRKESFGGGWEWGLREHVHGEGGQPFHSSLATLDQTAEKEGFIGERRSEGGQRSMVDTLGEDDGEVRV